MGRRFRSSSLSDEDLLNGLIKLSKKLNKTPSRKDMLNGNSITKRLYLYDRRFGGLSKACELAKITPNKGGKELKYTEKELLDHIMELTKLTGKVPTQKDIQENGKYSVGAYKRHFGTYNSALKKLNIGYNLKRNIQKEEIISSIIGVYNQLGRSPTAKEINNMPNIPSATIAYKKLEVQSWNEVLKICGLPVIHNKNLTKEELKHEIKRLKKELGRVPGYYDMSQLGKYSPEAYANHFGSYLVALKHFGYDYVPNEKIEYRKTKLDEEIKTMLEKKSKITTKPNCPDNEILTYNGTLLTKKYLTSLDIDIRKSMVEDLVNFFYDRDFYNVVIDKKDIKKEWDRLLKNNIEIKDNAIHMPPNTGNKIYKYFFPNLMKLSTKKSMSVYDALSDRDILEKIVKNRLGIGYKEFFTITPNMIKQGAKSTGIAAHGSQFKPLVAKALYKKYVKDGDSVLDFSCGFGSRLIGLMATQMNVKYYGYEPNTETYNNLLRMAQFFNFDVDIRKCGSEEYVFDRKFDFIFSSPPYFDHEIYCDEITQCYNKFTDYSEWLEKYWRETLKNIKRMSHKKTVIAINAGNSSNKKMKTIYNDINNEAIKLNYQKIDEINIVIPRSHFGKSAGKSKKEPIVIYTI